MNGGLSEQLARVESMGGANEDEHTWAHALAEARTIGPLAKLKGPTSSLASPKPILMAETAPSASSAEELAALLHIASTSSL